MQITTISSRGRLTIPARVRKRLRLTPGTNVSVFELEGKIYVRKIDAKHPSDKNTSYNSPVYYRRKGKR